MVFQRLAKTLTFLSRVALSGYLAGLGFRVKLSNALISLQTFYWTVASSL